MGKSAAKQKVLAAVVQMDPQELTVRLLEVGIKLSRPDGRSAASIMAELRQGVAQGAVPAYIIADFERMAIVAMEYLKECVNNIEDVH